MSVPVAKGPEIKGWCPGALRPMESGDGWLVRIRPPGGMLTPAQARGIAVAAQAYGNGVLDLSSRANLQVRGVRIAAHAGLVDDLQALGVVDGDVAAEAARNVTVTPFWQPGDGAQDMAARLVDAMGQVQGLPGKFGAVVDTGMRPVLQDVPGDIRLERDGAGGLILRPDGHGLGMPVVRETVGKAALTLLNWFLATGGATGGRGRMAAHVARGMLPEGLVSAPAQAVATPRPGQQAEGVLVGLGFGQMRAETLMALADLGHALRLTPWRMILIAGATGLPDLPGLITSPDDPLLRVIACTGAPGCAQAQGVTRVVAQMLAPTLPKGAQLHVSGCTKGCAHPKAADVTLVARGAGYDLIRHGTAADMPVETHIPPDALVDVLKACHAP